MFGLAGKRKTLRKTDKEQLGRFSSVRASLMGTKPCRNLHLVPKPCRNPHLACRGGAGLAASCSHRQTSGRWGGGCFSSSRSDGDASSGALLGLSPACSRQIHWTGFAGPGSYLRVEREMKPPEEKPRKSRGECRRD